MPLAATPPASPQSRNDRLFVTAFYWLSTFCDGASRIIIPLYFTTLGIAAKNIGIMFFFYELFGFLTNICAGFLINRIGYKKSFILALLCHSLASFLYLALDPNLPFAIAMTIISTARALRGVGKELVKTTSGAYTKRSHSGKQFLFAQVLLGGKDGMKGVGVLLGGLLLSWLAFPNALLLLGGLTTAAMIAASVVLQDYREESTVSLPDFLAVKKKMKRLAWHRAFLYAGRDTWLVIAVPIHLAHLGYDSIRISGLLAVGLIIFGASQPLFAQWLHRGVRLCGKTLTGKIRYRDSLFPSTMLLMLVPFSLVWAPDSIPLLIATVMAYNLLAALATVPHNHLHLKYARKKRSSVDIAYYKTIAQVGKLAAVVASGYVYQEWGLLGCMLAATGSLLVANIIGFGMRKKPRRPDASSNP